MGQLIARFTSGIEKADINLEYETYGVEGERDYAIDGNGEYEYDYDDMEGTSDHPSTQRITRPKVWMTLIAACWHDRLYHKTQPKAKKRRKCCFWLVTSSAAIIVAALAAFYFLHIATKGKLLGLPPHFFLLSSEPTNPIDC